jgi:hypothetical protein
MSKAQAFVVDTLAATVDDLCQKFGVWKTTHALILAVWRRRQTTNQVSNLSNHMRRDIGLEAPPGKPDSYFELRRR